MHSTDFEYAGKRLSDFGWITGVIGGNSGTEEVNIGCDITFNTVKNNNSSIHSSTSSSYDSVYSTSFQIVKKDCGSEEDKYPTYDEVRAMYKWLNRRKYEKFKPIPDDDEHFDIHYFGSFNIQEVFLADRIIGLTLMFNGNAPYGYGDVNQCQYEITEGMLENTTISGETIVSTDSANRQFEGLNVFGKSILDGTPTVDNPVEIVDCENTEISITDFSVIPYPYSFQSQEINGIRYDVNSDGSIRITGKLNTATSDFYLFGTENDNGKHLFLKKGTYSYSDGASVFDGANAHICYLIAEPVSLLNPQTLVQRLKTQDLHISEIFIRCNNTSITYNETIVPILSVGDAIPTFVKRHPYQTVQIPYVLRGIPVSDGGNYTDTNGQQWIADCVDFARKKLIRYCKRKRVLSNQPWVSVATGSRFYARDNDFKKCSNTNDVAHVLCTHFKPVVYNTEMGKTDMSITYINESTNGFIYRYDGINDVNTWKKFLDDNEVYIVGVRNTPIEIDLTDEEVEIYKELYLNHPTTTIVTNNEVGIELVYVPYSDNTFSIFGDSDETDYTIYPKVRVKCCADGDLKITNKTTKNYVFIANCKKGEVITMDGEYGICITNMKNEHITFTNDFNFDFLDIQVGDENFENQYEVSIPCEISVAYSPIRKVGV